jgi:hypothetical protein
LKYQEEGRHSKRFETWIEIEVSRRGKTFTMLSLADKISWVKQTMLEKEECDCGEVDLYISQFFKMMPDHEERSWMSSDKNF